MLDQLTFFTQSLIIILPVLGFIFLSTLLVFRKNTSEKFFIKVISIIMVLQLIFSLLPLFNLLLNPMSNHYHYGIWFLTDYKSYPLILLCDYLSCSLSFTAAFITSIVGYFSSHYLHRDSGFFRYFLNYLMFACGIQLIFLAGTMETLITGWEIVGISSVCLISFFQTRASPVRNGFLVFQTYRVCDLGLLIASVLMYHYFSNSHLEPLDYKFASSPPILIGLMFIFASLGKSAQLPFSYWVPRAMEGPTPSSAIYYGALSIHAGAYLLIRTSYFWEQHLALQILIILIGLLTASYASLLGRVRSDVKTMLAYASIAQVGCIFVEIGFGFYKIALLHMVGHSFIRTIQFLTAPSTLYEYQFYFGEELANKKYIEKYFPEKLRSKLFYFSLREFFLREIIFFIVINPILSLAHQLQRWEKRL